MHRPERRRDHRCRRRELRNASAFGDPPVGVQQARVGVVAERVLVVQPGVLRGERHGLLRLAVHRDLQRGGDAAAVGGVRDAVAHGDRVGGLGERELDVLAGRELNGLPTGCLGRQRVRRAVGTDHDTVGGGVLGFLLGECDSRATSGDERRVEGGPGDRGGDGCCGRGGRGSGEHPRREGESGEGRHGEAGGARVLRVIVDSFHSEGRLAAIAPRRGARDRGRLYGACELRHNPLCGIAAILSSSCDSAAIRPQGSASPSQAAGSPRSTRPGASNQLVESGRLLERVLHVLAGLLEVGLASGPSCPRPPCRGRRSRLPTLPWPGPSSLQPCWPSCRRYPLCGLLSSVPPR